jgi:hypothetical protein
MVAVELETLAYPQRTEDGFENRHLPPVSGRAPDAFERVGNIAVCRTVWMIEACPGYACRDRV